MPKETYEKWLPCQLTDEEVKAAATELGEASIKLNKLEAEKKEVNKNFNDRIGLLEDDIKILGPKVVDYKEERPIKVNVELDFNNKTRNHIRMDTGEIILEEPLREEDKQEEMNL